MITLYQILIADDEPYALEGLIHGVPFRELGFDQVFAVDNVSEAKQILLSNNIDIVLSDIEMPDESGLDLLMWMNEYHMDAVPIILTCHADFEYSRIAMKSGSFDYILKPIAYEEVTETLKRALTRVEQKKKYHQANRHEQLLIKNRERLTCELWTDIFNGDLKPTSPVMEELCLIKNMFFIRDALYRVVLVDFLILEPDDGGYSESKRLISGLRKLTEQDGWLISIGSQCVVILRRNRESYIHSLALREKLADICLPCSREGRLSFNIFFSQNVEAFQIPEAFSRLRRSAERRCIKTGVIEKITDDVELEKIEPSLPDVSLWVKMMETEPAEKLIAEMVYYARSTSAAGGISETGYLEVCTEVCVQAVYVSCSKLNIRTDFILSSDLQRQIHMAIRGQKYYSEFVRTMIAAFCKRRDSIYHSRRKSLTEQTKDYVEAHLGERLQNDQIAQALFLNVDHLNRIFKKETGMTLSEYIRVKRIDRAKLLLLTTRMPVSEVAMSVGFQSFSYFSKIFKKRVGVEPSKFRASNS